jgi:lipopolysaccharide/colanic/teichoic acid biosynthesis glycosyltransferase
MRRLYKQLFINVLISLLVYTISILFYGEDFLYSFGKFMMPGLIFYGLHIFVSLANRKYECEGTRHGYMEFTRLYLHSWLITTGLALLTLVTFQINWISRLVLLINIFGLIGGELLYICLVCIFRHSVQIKDLDEIDAAGVIDVAALYPASSREDPQKQKEQAIKIINRAGTELTNLIAKFIQLDTDHTLVLNTNTMDDVLNAPLKFYTNIVNIHKINNIRRINKFLEAANSRLPVDGMIMISAETKDQRKERIMNKYPPLLNSLYYAADFLVMRVFPKLPVCRSIYFFLTKGNKRVLSRPEVLGRLYSCGFEVITEQVLQGRLYVFGCKKKLPAFNPSATYGPLIHLSRVGKNKKMINVYKFRTMHPFSEYLQDYIYKQNHLDNGGKIKDDFRVTTVGKFLRKFWIDELPMFFNFFRGDLKLVGVRPVSRHYFSLYTPELQEKRVRHKPGLIPPFYSDLPGTIEEIMDSEIRYLDQYEKNPLKTDLTYFFKAAYNILFRRARSK